MDRIKGEGTLCIYVFWIFSGFSNAWHSGWPHEQHPGLSHTSVLPRTAQVDTREIAETCQSWATQTSSEFFAFKTHGKNTMTRPIVLALGRLSWGQLSSRAQNSLIPSLPRETPTPWKCYPLEAVETPTMLLSTTSSCCSKGEDADLSPFPQPRQCHPASLGT